MYRRVKDVGHPDEQMLSVFREYGVVVKESHDNLNRTAEDRSIYQLIHPGWLAANRMKAWQGSVGISPYRGIVSGHYICFMPRHAENDRFLNWLFRSQVYTRGYESISRGVRIGQAEIDNAVYGAMPVLVPPAAEQRAIADYLDRETAQIDALIGKQERLIETLRERQVALIEHALDGIPGRRRLKYLSSVTLGKMLDAGREVAEGAELLPYVRAANLRQTGAVDVSDLNRMPFTVFEAERLDLRRDDVLVVEGGAMGRPAYVREDLTGICFQKTVNRVRPFPDRAHGRFLFYTLLQLDRAGHHRAHVEAVSMPHLTAEKLAVVSIPWAPVPDQRRLADELDTRTSALDALIAKAERFITLARERRAALITAAVTGQIDVRAAS